MAEFCYKMGISELTFCHRKKLQGTGRGRGVPLRVLEEDNRKLRELVADLSLDKQMLQGVLRKSSEPFSTAPRTSHLHLGYRISMRQAWEVLTPPRGPRSIPVLREREKGS